MFRKRLIGLLLGALIWTSSADAQEQASPIVKVNYMRALELAREQAPQLIAARARAREAESHIAAASVYRLNPQVSAAVGPRFRSQGTIPQWQVGAQQWLELGGQRGDRIDAAKAGSEAGVARSEDASRKLLSEVSFAFISVLYWQRRVALAEENIRIFESIARVEARRHEVGDVGGLERSVAALALARARSSAHRALATREQEEGRLKMLLGLAPATELVVEGDLRKLGAPETHASNTRERADVRALEADIKQSEAEALLGRSNRVPNIALGARYSREESDDILQGTLIMELPVFDRGQGTSSVAEARGQRLRAELDATKSAAAFETVAARAMTQQLNAAARRFEQEGLETLQRAERLATKSYEAGAVPLIDVLAIRKQLLQAKLDYVDLLLEAAKARVELAASSGALQ